MITDELDDRQLSPLLSRNTSPQRSRTPKRSRSNSLPVPELGMNCVKEEVETALQSMGITQSIQGMQKNMELLGRSQDETMHTANQLVLDLDRVLKCVDFRLHTHQDATQQLDSRVDRLQAENAQTHEQNAARGQTNRETFLQVGNAIRENQQTVYHLSNSRYFHPDSPNITIPGIAEPSPPRDAWAHYNAPVRMEQQMPQNSPMPPYSNGSSREREDPIRQNNAFGGSMNTPMISNSKICAPPAFDSVRFLSWEKDLLFWRDLYWHVPESQLLSIIGIHSSASLKKFLIPFLRESRMNPQRRTIAHLLECLQSQFAASVKEREVSFLDDVMNIKREGSESIQNFWFRYQELCHNLNDTSIYLTDGMMFVRLLKAINVSTQSRLAIISRLDCRNQEHTVNNLRQVSIELFGIYSTTGGKSENIMTMQDHPSDDEEGDSDEPIEVLIAKVKKKMRKPGFETSSIRKSIALSNIPNRQFTPSGKAVSRDDASKKERILLQVWKT